MYHALAAFLFIREVLVSSTAQSGAAALDLGLAAAPSHARARARHSRRIVYNTTISACGRARDFTSALALLREMDARGVAPSVVTYSAAITAAGHAGEWRAGLELKAEMEARGVAPNAFTCVAARPNKQTARLRSRIYLRCVLCLQLLSASHFGAPTVHPLHLPWSCSR